MENKNKIWDIIFNFLKSAFKKSLKTFWFVMKIIIPIHFILTLFVYLDILKYIVIPFAPLMALFGLPGEAALAIISSNLLTPIAGLSIVTSIPGFTVKQLTVLGIMTLISHALVAESAVLKGIGVPIKRSVIIRVCGMIIFGLLFSLIIGNKLDSPIKTTSQNNDEIIKLSFESWNTFWTWFKELLISFGNKIWGSLKTIGPMIFYLTFGIEFLKVTKILDHINFILHFFTKPLGISRSGTIPLFVGMFFGITYGASVIMQSYENNEMTKDDILIISLFVCLSHAIIEDTIYYVNAGANIWYLLIIRILLTYVITFIYNKFVLKRKPKEEIVEITNNI